FVTNVDPESVDVARRVWCSARDGAALPANPARTRVRDQRREPSVGEQSDSRCRRTALRLPDGKVIGRSWCRFHPIEFRPCDRLDYLEGRKAFAEKQLSRLDPWIGVETLHQNIAIESIVQRSQNHALVVSHV